GNFARRGRWLCRQAGPGERLRSGPGPVGVLFGLSLSLRAADRADGAAVVASRLLRRGGPAPDPAGPAQAVAPVDQRSRGDGSGLVAHGAAVLSRMGRTGGRLGLV